MAWVPSHQELRDHPKTRRAARRAGVSIPAIVGHLHLLWHWALDHAPEGDLSKYEADDIADAAMWDGDPDVFVQALRDCGPGDSNGFLTDDWQLHDWDEYGGAYARRVKAARKAAAARWESTDDADAVRTQSEGNANASGGASLPQTNGNAEKRTVEERTEEDRQDRAADAAPPDPPPPKPDHDDTFEDFWSRYPRGKAGKPGGDGAKKPALKRWRRMSDRDRAKALLAVDNYRAHVEAPGGPYAAHAITWLNQERWEQWQTPAERQPGDDVHQEQYIGGVPAS